VWAQSAIIFGTGAFSRKCLCDILSFPTNELARTRKVRRRLCREPIRLGATCSLTHQTWLPFFVTFALLFNPSPDWDQILLEQKIRKVTKDQIMIQAPSRFIWGSHYRGGFALGLFRYS
jgi:hypothetical protein